MWHWIKKSKHAMKQEYMTNNKDKNILVERDQEMTDKRNK